MGATVVILGSHHMSGVQRHWRSITGRLAHIEQSFRHMVRTLSLTSFYTRVERWLSMTLARDRNLNF